MLRLRPSEITITAEDVEEATRDIARNKTRLQRGPVRSLDTARRYLANSPDVRPRKALYGMHGGVDWPSRAEREGGNPSITPSVNLEGHTSPVMTPYTEDLTDEPSTFPSPIRNTQLVFRPAPGPALSDSRRVRNGTPGGHEEGTHAPMPRSNQPVGARNASRTTSNGTSDLSPSEPHPRSRNANAWHLKTAIHSSSVDCSQTLDMSIPSISDHSFSHESRMLPKPHILPNAVPAQHASHSAVNSRTESAPGSASTSSLNAGSSGIESCETTKPRSSLDHCSKRRHTRFDAFQERTRSFFGRSRDALSSHKLGGAIGRSQRHISRQSEASTDSSLPYSLYGVPISNSPSDTPSRSEEQLPHSQYSGAGSFRHVVREGLISRRPAENNRRSAVFPAPPLPRIESVSLPNLLSAVRGQALSPRPAAPYSRLEAHIPRLTPGDRVVDVDVGQDASNAVERRLPSPRGVVMDRGQLELFHVTGGASGISQRRRGMHVGQRPLETRADAHPNPSDGSAEHSPQRGARHSSENLPVGASPNTSGTQVSQPSLSPGRRVSFANNPQRRPSPPASVPSAGVAVFPAPVRLEAPQRRNSVWPSRPSLLEPVRNANDAPPRRRTPVPTPSLDLHSGTNGHGRRRRQDPPQRPRVYPIRESTSATMGMAARPPVPVLSASRLELRGGGHGQVQPHADQENSGEAEEEMMRRELEAAGMRYGGHGGGREGLEVLDETPPRMGRLERWMEG
ncbi:uncharacterized protein EI97DRAFT_319371 [Westerdykella ornata]|uniref:Uncharacterized protein n=1 Tax=Westerdykella ornata TaxID=318751 RepID=A0A6A6JJG4_WESOR|nr:uncharacterized protein EI97DRAFT_319371 [Westerdykella ornata]KAF2276721.1 hypothetical protein EI97DRAFT_319371 [Westerdykella ornata]